MKARFVISLFATTLFLSSAAVSLSDAQTLDTRYNATSIAGNQAPPVYGLRLDGFFTGNPNDEVTFGFDSVLFDTYTDGTARLYGTVSVAEFNDTGGPGIYSSVWDLDVHFNSGSGSNGSYDYYVIDPSAGIELVNQADSNDFANFVTYNDHFQVGDGANEKNSNFGAAGWVNFAHDDNGTTYGSLSTHWNSSDFLMDLTVVPEPISSTLFVVGAATLGFRRLRKMKKNI